MKVAIIGYGFVGKALHNGIKNTEEIIKIDPIYGNDTNDLKSFLPDIIFICVPTPMNDNNTQDLSILNEVIDEIIDLKIKSLIVIKSTVLPKSLDEISKKIDNFIYNPEFLREKHADEDFINAPFIILGGDKKAAKSLALFYQNYTKCASKNYRYMDHRSASLLKYTINSFLAMKVVFFNELKQLYDEINPNLDWDEFINNVAQDKRIGHSHMSVPGHDGRLGYGGACLPKDSNAIFEYSNSINKPLSLLKNAIKTNNKLRGKYNSRTERERMQNINFEIND